MLPSLYSPSGMPVAALASVMRINLSSGRSLAVASKQPIAVHLDHATNPGLVRAAADLGFSSVMYD